MTNPKVSEKDMLDVLSAIVGAADGEGAMDRRDHEAIQVIRAAIEERGRLREHFVFLKKLADEAFVGSSVSHAEHALMRNLALKHLANAIRDFKLDGEERK